jgi:hypothetical protein
MVVNENNMAYTYLIGWSIHNKWYYGVRYAKNCKPEELWKTYFTSSKHVKQFRLKRGEPDIIEIRKIFKDKYKAVLWEQKVLKRLNVEKNKKFLNTKNSTTSTIITTQNITSFKKGNVPWNKGLNLKEIYGGEWTKRYSRTKSQQEKQKLSLTNKKRFANSELRILYSHKTKEKFANSEFKSYHLSRCKSHSDKIWINDGIKNRRVTEENYLLKFPLWKRGRIISGENLLKMKKGRQNGNSN